MPDEFYDTCDELGLIETWQWQYVLSSKSGCDKASFVYVPFLTLAHGEKLTAER